MTRCSDCNRQLHAYEQSGVLMAECTNPECRLYYVTLTPDALDTLTEDERAMWDKTTRTFRSMALQEQREHDARISKTPAHLRRIG